MRLPTRTLGAHRRPHLIAPCVRSAALLTRKVARGSTPAAAVDFKAITIATSLLTFFLVFYTSQC